MIPRFSRFSRLFFRSFLCITQVNQWKNTDEVISWLESLKNKDSCSFIQLDIKEFYPTITKKVLNEAFDFAKLYTAISDKELRTIYCCRKSLLPQYTKNSFDVTMGSFDRAEICAHLFKPSSTNRKAATSSNSRSIFQKFFKPNHI